MTSYYILATFFVGYLAITLENSLRINKAASALITGVLCWTIFIFSGKDTHQVLDALEGHLSEIAGILFFLLSAMVIVELVDAHDGFDIITEKITTKSRRKLLWLLAWITFFLSAILDNLTTTIVMVSLARRILNEREDRLLFAGIIVIAANAGGAWSPIGDVTTTMLWIGGQVSAVSIMKMLFIPSFICLLVPLSVFSLSTGGSVSEISITNNQKSSTPPFERNTVFLLGLGVIVLVPVFKTITHLPPFMGILLGLGIIWGITEYLHYKKDAVEKGILSVNHALRKIDTPSILFFLGILLAVAALQAAGILSQLAQWLNNSIGDLAIIGILIGFLSAVVDNVPLVAAAQGMYSLSEYPTDHFLWEYLAFCTGTGGSALIIGSAAGIAAMGIEKIDFFWYLKRISLLAVLGYLSGAVCYLFEYNLMHSN
jgi:Na+/H+ antiporter NhaD/arsenite permease-like protein